MSKSKNKKKPIIIGEDYIKIQRKLNREIELERNGGRWVAVNRTHKSKKDYDRKRDKKVNLDDSYLSFFYFLFFEHVKPLAIISLLILNVVSFNVLFIIDLSFLKFNSFFCLAYRDIVTYLL